MNKQQSVLCQHDLSLHPTQLANGVVWEPCPGTEGWTEGIQSKLRKGLFAHPVHFFFAIPF